MIHIEIILDKIIVEKVSIMIEITIPRVANAYATNNKILNGSSKVLPKIRIEDPLLFLMQL